MEAMGPNVFTYEQFTDLYNQLNLMNEQLSSEKYNPRKGLKVKEETVKQIARLFNSFCAAVRDAQERGEMEKSIVSSDKRQMTNLKAMKTVLNTEAFQPSEITKELTLVAFAFSKVPDMKLDGKEFRFLEGGGAEVYVGQHYADVKEKCTFIYPKHPGIQSNNSYEDNAGVIFQLGPDLCEKINKKTEVGETITLKVYQEVEEKPSISFFSRRAKTEEEEDQEKEVKTKQKVLFEKELVYNGPGSLLCLQNLRENFPREEELTVKINFQEAKNQEKDLDEEEESTAEEREALLISHFTLERPLSLICLGEGEDDEGLQIAPLDYSQELNPKIDGPRELDVSLDFRDLSASISGTQVNADTTYDLQSGYYVLSTTPFSSKEKEAPSPQLKTTIEKHKDDNWRGIFFPGKPHKKENLNTKLLLQGGEKQPKIEVSLGIDSLDSITNNERKYIGRGISLENLKELYASQTGIPLKKVSQLSFNFYSLEKGDYDKEAPLKKENSSRI